MKYTTNNPKINEYKELVKRTRGIYNAEVTRFKKMYGWDLMLVDFIKNYEERYNDSRKQGITGGSTRFVG